MLRPLYRISFSLNLGFAIALAATLLGLRNQVGFVHGIAQSPGYLQQLVMRINTACGRVPWHQLGTLLFLAALTLAVSACLWLIFRFIDRKELDSPAQMTVTGIAAATAVPVSWFLVPSKGWYAVLLEFVFLGGVLYLSRRRPNPIWFAALTVHYSIWAWALWILAHDEHLVPLDWPWPILLSMVAPCSGYVWAFYAVQVRRMARS